MSIENVIQEHTKAIQENTVAITLLATAVSKIALTGATLDSQAAAAATAAQVAAATAAAGASVNLEAKQSAPKKEKPATTAAPEPKPEPAVETAPALTYEADVKPQLVKVAQLPDGRTKLSNLLAYFKAKTGAELKQDQFETVLEHVKALLETESLV